MYLLDFTSTALFSLHTDALSAVPCVIISQEADHLDESFYNWNGWRRGVSEEERLNGKDIDGSMKTMTTMARMRYLVSL